MGSPRPACRLVGAFLFNRDGMSMAKQGMLGYGDHDNAGAASGAWAEGLI